MFKKTIGIILINGMLLYALSAHAAMNFAKRMDVQHFIKTMEQKYHFKKKYLAQIFSQVQVRPRVIQSIHAPAEHLPWYVYRSIFLTDSHIREGVAFWNEHEDILNHAEKKYGVPINIIVATIGVETKYGKNKGEYRVIDALTNLAFSDSPRAGFFRSELMQFLLLSREQHLNPLKVLGSYAGAIGQPQFMPSSYRNYAVSYSGHKHIDLNNNIGDIICSTANYYKKHGWQTDQPIVVSASVMRDKLLTRERYPVISSREIIRHGIKAHGRFTGNEKLKVIELQNYYGREYWLGFHNFTVIKLYNPSDLYAMAVFELSEYIAATREKLNHG